MTRPKPCDLAQSYIEHYNIEDPADLCVVYRYFGCPDSDCGEEDTPPGDPTMPWVVDGVPDGLGDPFKDPPRIGNVELARGTFTSTEIDLSLPSPGFSWVIARANTRNRRDPGNGDKFTLAENSTQGYNWMQLSQPELTVTTGVLGDVRRVTLRYQSDGYMEFLESGTAVNVFLGYGSNPGGLKFIPGSDNTPNLYEYYDQRGTVSTFFDPLDSRSSHAAGRLWKIVDANGNTAWVGHPTDPVEAVDDGYGSSGIEMAVDPGNRRYTYDYDTVGSLTRLVGVVAETKTSGTWEGTPGGVATVGQVTYSYYDTDEADLGLTGDLKTAQVELPLTDTSVKDTRTRYYRYYTSTSADPKTPHMLKLILGAEGTRQYDWAHDTDDPRFDGDYTGETDANLKPYAEQYLNYYGENDIRVKEFFASGACGCGSQSGGLYSLFYTLNTGFPDDRGYNVDWYSQTVVQQPDSTYMTYLIDQAAQPIAEIRSSGDPATSIGSYWVTRFLRDAAGLTTKLVSPAATTAYSHSTKAFTTSDTAGLVTVYEYYDDWDLQGIVHQTKWKEGVGATQPEKLLSTRFLMARGFSLGGDPVWSEESAWLFRPFLTSSWDYAEEVTTGSTHASPASGSHETITEYVFYNTTTNTNVQYLVPQVITVTYPEVSESNNGSGDPITSKQFQLADGRVTFTRSVDAIISYMGYDTVTGQPSVSVADADTEQNGTDEVFEDVVIPAGFESSTSAVPLHYVTKLTYDPQGRPDTTTIPSGRVMKRAYAALKDRQIVEIVIPRVASATYYGPASYVVSNHNDSPTFLGTISLTSSGTTTDPSAWIDETDVNADPITALDVGTPARMATSLYDSAGVRLKESRRYFLIPPSGVGSAGTNYDKTKYSYDAMGRHIRTQDPSTTINRTVYDALGRPTEQWIGTHDTGLEEGESGSAPNNMTKVSTTEYDGGNDKGNSYITKITLDPDGDWSGTTTDQRKTEYMNDVRGRAIVTAHPIPPHALDAFDNAGRLIAQGIYNSTTGLTVSSDPTETSGNRLGLYETLYNERGNPWKIVQHKIDAFNGDKLDTVVELTWYDPIGRPIKVVGPGRHSKTRHDRLGRVVDELVLAKDDDADYDDVYDTGATNLVGDTVFEQDFTVYDNEGRTGNVILSASVARFHNDLSNGTTGLLHTNADNSLYRLEADDVEGRLTSLHYRRFDDLDRLTGVADYGANGTGNASDLDIRPSGWLAFPDRSDDILVTTYAYHDDGALKDVVDPMGRTRRTEYDGAGRVIKEIVNYTTGTDPDENQTIKYEYAAGLRIKYIADLPTGETDQETVYAYGTPKGTSSGESSIATGHLLQKVTYPDSSGSADAVTYAYNALGQDIYRQDQTATILQKEYDTAGRVTKNKATPNGTISGAVKRIETSYDARGQRDTVTQYDAASGGNVVDQVKYVYDDWGNVIDFKQDRNSTVATTGGDEYSVSYSYAKATPTGGRPTVRGTGTTLPGSVTVTFNYASSSYNLADVSSRVSGLNLSTTPVAAYEYLGEGHLVGTDLPQPAVSSRVYSAATTYDNLDRFGRVSSNRWKVNTEHGRDFFRVDLAHDRNYNITLQRDLIQKDYSATGDPERFSAKYTMDGLDRLIEAKEGHWNGSTISIVSRAQEWTLSQSGHWVDNEIDLDGDGTADIDESSTFNAANELTARTISSTTYDPDYDAAGNLIDDGENYLYVYDAWGRLVAVKSRAIGNPLVAEYRYNGLGYRIGWHYDTDLDQDVDGNDPWYYFVYDTSWRIVATFRSNDTSPKERFVWHNAGSNGTGDASYIDSVVFREKDITASWTAATTTATDERLYYCQNWRADVVALVSELGEIKERISYSASGVPTRIDPADINCDGFVDGVDSDTFNNAYEAPSDEADVNFDGFLDGTDSDLFNNWYADPGDQGRGVISRSGIANRIGYAGYQFASELADPSWHVRHRVLNSNRGNWSNRDPIGYADSLNLYQYSLSNAIRYLDPFGLQPVIIPLRPTPIVVPKIRPYYTPPTQPYVPMPNPQLSPEIGRLFDPLLYEIPKPTPLPNVHPDITKDPQTLTEPEKDVEPVRDPNIHRTPCAHIFREYKRLDRELQKKNCAGVSCKDGKALFDKIRRLHSLRALMKACRIKNGEPVDSGHDEAIEGVYNRMNNCWREVKKACDKENLEKWKRLKEENERAKRSGQPPAHPWT